MELIVHGANSALELICIVHSYKPTFVEMQPCVSCMVSDTTK